MSTSFQFPSDHHPINLISQDHQTKPTQKMIQTATGRKRSSKNIQKKKKQPQRGMGVAQLERLRMQDHIKNTTSHHQYFSTNFLNFTTASASVAAVADPGIYNSILNSSPVFPQFPKLCVSPDFFVQQKVVNTGVIGSSNTTRPAMSFGFGNQLVSSHDHQFQSQNMGLCGFPTSSKASEKSKELSSMPNFKNTNNKSCFFDRCLSCNKKKRMINGEDMNIHMEDMIRENQSDFGTKPLFQPCRPIPTRLQKGVEIVAIHRKGSSSLSDEGAVVMEYDFFLDKSGSKISTNTSCFGKMISTKSSESSSVVAVGNNNGEASCVTTISWTDTITTPTSSIDLSLKLSC
ncbi:uncharacterized protein LOC132038656 [Lycium ferocissimum]|uniref:uncharacterized protein LOC132038656 n=1 Tax=Lycium ferocissimum TaxID=112874 RepID=UPI00281575FA|nr:uncharacterized protein LOC132038656 [Lycium ferocissimum]